MNSTPPVKASNGAGQSQAELVAVPVRLQVGAPLNAMFTPESSDSLCLALQSEFDQLFQVLGIPGKSVVSLEPASVPERLLRLWINDRQCFYPDELPLWVFSYVSEQHLSPQMDAQTVNRWLESCKPEPSSLLSSSCFEFLRLACLEIAKLHPGMLLNPELVQAYLATLPFQSASEELSSPEFIAKVHTILSQVVDLWISIGDHETVANRLLAGIPENRFIPEVTEDLIAVLSPNLIELQFHPDTLREITLDGESETDQFLGLRDGFYYDLGIRLPDIRFTVNPQLKKNAYAFRINHLFTLPTLALKHSQRLLAEDLETMTAWKIPAQAGINPVTRLEISLVDDSALSQLPKPSITWTRLGQVILHASAILRQKAACFVNTQSAGQELANLNTYFPDLLTAVNAKYTLAQQTAVLRELVSESFSLLDLYNILEALVDFDFIVADATNNIVIDDRLATSQPPSPAWLNDPANLASFVRSRFKRYLAYHSTNGQLTLAVYLLSPEIEKRFLAVADGQPLSDEEYDTILSGIRSQVDLPALGPWKTAFLTSIEIRPYLSKLVRSVWPGVQVLAYQELTPYININPVARIGA